MAELKKYYSELYTPRSLKTETECMDYLQSLNLIKLSNDDRLSCEGKLTLQECQEALNSMETGKTPGNDGLTKEFLYVSLINLVNSWFPPLIIVLIMAR